jgi:hypothetical protein
MNLSAVAEIDTEEDGIPPALPYATSRFDDRYTGIRILWLKVIVRAIFDWITYRDSDRLMQKKLADSAHSWLFDQSILFNGFENICTNLGINPMKVRERAKCMTREDVAKIEHLERTEGLQVAAPLLLASE